MPSGVVHVFAAPRYDTDEAGQIHRIFELGREFDVDIDMHLDVGPTAGAMNIHLVRELASRRSPKSLSRSRCSRMANGPSCGTA